MSQQPFMFIVDDWMREGYYEELLKEVGQVRFEEMLHQYQSPGRHDEVACKALYLYNAKKLFYI